MRRPKRSLPSHGPVSRLVHGHPAPRYLFRFRCFFEQDENARAQRPAIIIATVTSVAIDPMAPANTADSAMRASLSWARGKRRRAMVIMSRSFVQPLGVSPMSIAASRMKLVESPSATFSFGEAGGTFTDDVNSLPLGAVQIGMHDQPPHEPVLLDGIHGRHAVECAVTHSHPAVYHVAIVWRQKAEAIMDAQQVANTLVLFARCTYTSTFPIAAQSCAVSGGKPNRDACSSLDKFQRWNSDMTIRARRLGSASDGFSGTEEAIIYSHMSGDV